MQVILSPFHAQVLISTPFYHKLLSLVSASYGEVAKRQSSLNHPGISCWVEADDWKIMVFQAFEVVFCLLLFHFLFVSASSLKLLGIENSHF